MFYIRKYFMFFVVSLCFVACMSTPISFANTTEKNNLVDLKSANDFAILSCLSLDGYGINHVIGNVGVEANDTIFGFTPESVKGTQEIKNKVTNLAQYDALKAYDFVKGMDRKDEISGDIGGQTIEPGVHYVSRGLSIEGTATLDAKGNSGAMFIFVIDDTLRAKESSKILLKGGALASNVIWVINGNVYFEKSAQFIGTVLTKGDIDLKSNTFITGRLVTLLGRISALDSSVSIPEKPDDSVKIIDSNKWAKLHIITRINASNNGRVGYSDFPVVLMGVNASIPESKLMGSTEFESDYNILAGRYSIKVESVQGYIISYSGADDKSGNITLNSNDDKTVIITVDNEATFKQQQSVHTSPIDLKPDIKANKMAIKLSTLAQPSYATKPSNVIYIYQLKNEGDISLSKVKIVDKKLGNLKYLSGDLNKNQLLDANEVWTYAGSVYTKGTTTHYVEAQAEGNGKVIKSTESVKVVIKK